MEGSHYLIVAGCLSIVAALLHIAIIFGGPEWYRFFGAGEAMAQSAASGSIRPVIITFGIATLLTLWGFYALSAAGVLAPFPFLKVAIVLITGVYLLRGIVGLVLPFISKHPAIAQNSITFWLVSSTICCVFGIVHLIGLINRWEHL
ncbi:hypothetical protein [Alteromonas facilis]|uniref:hypothetical protein n=1 Tax=Alteromonas facilis TaxID=2048004 RepID=UPI000C287338|nr:hypothetical protein [Alteromonas facilis]